jgi:protocatechuate 3,4-dioxygenase beta subunit
MKAKLLIVLLSLAFLVIFPGLSLAQFGSISGRVTDEVTGLPIIGAHVRAMGDTCPGGGCGGAMTDSSGFYMIPHLHPGAYLVSASAYGYEDEVYPDSVIVVAGQNTPNIDFALTPVSGGTGSISGRVTDEATGLPIIGEEIRLSGMCHNVWYTDTSGLYTCDNVPPGIYLVSAHAIGYYPETYPDSVQVIEGQNTPNIDFALTPWGGTGSISGRVTDEETGLPIPMAHVWTYGDSGHPCCGGETWTDTAGYYLIQNLAPRQYTVGVHKCGYQASVYPESVTVYEGQNTPNIDFALTPIGEPGSISGTITDAQTGEPISWAHVWAYGEFGHGQAQTDSLGHYTIHSLYPGSYFVTAWAQHYHPQEYPDTVIVIEGQDTPNIDFALVPYGSPSQGVIAGQVLDDSTLSPIPNAIVFAISFGRNWGFDFTDSVGAYTIQRLPTDNYYVYAFACGYVGEFYDGVYTWEEAILVTPDAYNIDFSLGTCGSWGGGVSGLINSNGSPVEGAFVYAEVSGEVKGFARSSTDGGYVINGLLPGTYTVTASMVMYHDGSYPDPVGVVSGNVDGINIELPSVRVGDVTGEGTINVTDVIFLINYLYIGGPAPVPLMTGDANCDGRINITDVIHIINYLYIGGPSPCNP